MKSHRAVIKKICFPGENQSTIRNCLRKTKIPHVHYALPCLSQARHRQLRFPSLFLLSSTITSLSRFLILLLLWAFYSFFFLFRGPSFLSFFFIFLICKSTISPVVSESECFLPAWRPRLSIFSLSAHSLNFIFFFFKKRSCLKSCVAWNSPCRLSWSWPHRECSWLCFLRAEIAGTCYHVTSAQNLGNHQSELRIMNVCLCICHFSYLFGIPVSSAGKLTNFHEWPKY